MRLKPRLTLTPWNRDSNVYVVPPAVDEEVGEAASISFVQGDRTWSALPSFTPWTLDIPEPPPPPEPLTTDLNPQEPPSLSSLCLRNISDNIDRYEPSSFDGIPEEIVRLVWDHVDSRYSDAAAGGTGGVGLWTLKTKVFDTFPSFSSSSPSSSARGQDQSQSHLSIPSHTSSHPTLLLLSPAPTSPLLRLPHPPHSTAQFQFLTSLNLSGSQYVTDETLPHLRVLTRLRFLGLGGLEVSDVGIRRLGLALDYTTWNADGDLDVDGQETGGMRMLRAIWLDNCPRIGDEVLGKSGLSRWAFLNVISLKNTAVTPSAITRFLTTHPAWNTGTTAHKGLLNRKIANRTQVLAGDLEPERKGGVYEGIWPGAVWGPGSEVGRGEGRGRGKAWVHVMNSKDGGNVQTRGPGTGMGMGLGMRSDKGDRSMAFYRKPKVKVGAGGWDPLVDVDDLRWLLVRHPPAWDSIGPRGPSGASSLKGETRKGKRKGTSGEVMAMATVVKRDRVWMEEEVQPDFVPVKPRGRAVGMGFVPRPQTGLIPGETKGEEPGVRKKGFSMFKQIKRG